MLWSKVIPLRIFNDGTRWRSAVNVEIRPIYHRRNNHRYALNTLRGPKARMNALDKRKV
jgi:hypothetical protein